MSMNLIAFIGKEEVDLYQTPTHITYMCLMNKDGLIEHELTGDEAKKALFLYLEWVKSTNNGVWEDEEALESARQSLNYHVKSIMEIINEETLVVSVI